jgi:hypothetical protein
MDSDGVENSSDQDVGFCYTAYNGDDGGIGHRLGYTASVGDTFRTVAGPSLHTQACPHAAARKAGSGT